MLRAFLLENGIEISPREQYISINGMKHWIPMESRGCDTDEWENVGLLSAILYHDHGEVEAFIVGDQKEIIGYSTVKKNPEILHSVETVVKRLTRKDLGLEAKWQKNSPKPILQNLMQRYWTYRIATLSSVDMIIQVHMMNWKNSSRSLKMIMRTSG